MSFGVDFEPLLGGEFLFCATTIVESMERTLSFSVASVVEDVLQQHGNRLGNGGGGLDLESRRAEEAGNSAFF